MTKMNAEIKAQLIAIGSVDVDELLLSRPSASSAGPGTGLKSIFFKSGDHRVRLEINKESPLKMKNANGDFIILKNNKELARGELEPILAHCPEQAYITLSEQCIYDCKFCSVPKLQGKIKTLEDVITIVEKARKTGRLKVIALTSGIANSPEDEIDRVVQAVKALKKYNVPIGVSVHPTKDSSRRLKEAGVNEIKYNVETMDRAIFQQVCIGRKGHSLDYILESLGDAVKIFGKNKVSTNFIIGLGETDECVRQGVEYLANQEHEGVRIRLTHGSNARIPVQVAGFLALRWKRFAGHCPSASDGNRRAPGGREVGLPSTTTSTAVVPSTCAIGLRSGVPIRPTSGNAGGAAVRLREGARRNLGR